MTIDKFLDGNKILDYIEDKPIIRVPYNENIDYLFVSSWSEFSYRNSLNFVGIYEKITKKLYGSSLDFQSEYSKDWYSNYYAGSISVLKDNLINAANLYLNKYIEENKFELISMGQIAYNKYIADEYNYSRIQENAIKNYIYKHDINTPHFEIHSKCYESDIEKLMIEFMQNPIEVSKRIFNSYINSSDEIESIYYESHYHDIHPKEYIGVELLITQLHNSLVKELQVNTNNEYKKKHDIINSIKDLDAQMVTITIKKGEELYTFKYPRSTLYNLDFSAYRIPDLKMREKVEGLYKSGYYNNDNEFISDIARIEFSKKILYEDNELLNKTNETYIKGSPDVDITDDLFG